MRIFDLFKVYGRINPLIWSLCEKIPNVWYDPPIDMANCSTLKKNGSLQMRRGMLRLKQLVG